MLKKKFTNLVLHSQNLFSLDTCFSHQRALRKMLDS